MYGDPTSGQNLFNEHILTQDPSSSTFNYFHKLRLVSKDAQKHIKLRLDNTTWRQAWIRRGNEFCNDLPAGTALAPDAPLNAGLERMIRINRMEELVQGMDEFRIDETTQTLCIEQLQYMLRPHAKFMPGNKYPFWRNFQTYLDWAKATPGLFRSIISAVRAHPRNMRIQLGGCTLLIDFMSITLGPHDKPSVSRKLADYTIATLIENVHQNMDSLALARICFATLHTLVHMYSTTTAVPNKPFLMSGEHSIPGFVMTLMRMNYDDETLVYQSLRCMKILLVDARLPQNTAGLLAFNVSQAEKYILDSMAVSSPTHIYSGVPPLFIEWLQTLYDVFPQRVSRPTDVMASVVQSLMAYNQNPKVRDVAITLMSTIVEGFWSPIAPFRVLSADQTRPCVENIMPVVVCSLRAVDAHKVVNKNNCTTILNMLSLLCQNHPTQIALAKKGRFAEFLHYKYHPRIEDVVAHAVVDARYMAAYHHLEEILAGP